MKDLIEVIELAINAGDWKVDGACDPTMVLIRAKKSIEQVQKPEGYQEPVAWMDADGDLYKKLPSNDWHPPHTPLYISPPQRQPLTDEQVEKIIKSNMSLQMNLAGIRADFEAAHGITGEQK